MAAGAFTVLNIAKLKMLDGTHDLDTHVFKMALTTSAQALDATFAGTSGNARYSDLTAQVANGNGYTTGGKTLVMSVGRSGGTVTVDCDDQAWTSATFSAKYAVIYNDTAANKDLLCVVDLETGVGTGLSPSNGTLSVTINASGIFTLS
ncbi:hypothetical protein [Brevundimonas sp.]|uniref:hypothetical protein n=1 Tax=Brevundimonas sp. TaxID=1871086 RepID=UPI00289E8DDD|nr:hypothetical protein [Brevundimonas sp.]